MENRRIILSDNGIITVPGETKMNIAEIADLFGIYYQTAKKLIRDIEKSGVVGGDYSGSCTYEGSKIYPDYYGLEMVTAVAFRVQSGEADVFRKWLLRKIAKAGITEILILPIQNSILN
ncbi:MAG TPA: hypothetical protein PKC55_14280 [Dysgonomonas sp.]|nr:MULTISPECIES: hypothetical protein [unclassified Dysgonomonas]HML65994.1 hypothetical protein [Dysgonomonas sp.]